eukprot:EC715087.1.p1 GENE.EC715087.1~~EC715087.1.p1  ORF type:complete len:164 (+),score=20.98 EC715087.1:3-494(+)
MSNINRHLSRPTAHRLALFRSLVTSLIKHESIRTTVAKAKEVRPFVDHMITLAKQGTLHARRQADSFIYEDLMVQKLFYELAERYRTRPGGYTRIERDGWRNGDGAPMAVLQLVDAYKGPGLVLPKHRSIPERIRELQLQKNKELEEQAAAAATAPSAEANQS